MRVSSIGVTLHLALLSIVIVSLATATRYISAAGKEWLIYGDSLADGWQDWSWDTSADLGNTSPVHLANQGPAPAGSNSIAVSFKAADAGFKLHTDTLIKLADYDTLYFWVNGGKGGQKIRVVFEDANDKVMGDGVAILLPANAWVQVAITFNAFGPLRDIAAIDWADDTSSLQPTFYLDDIKVLSTGHTASTTGVSGPQPGPDLTVDAKSGQHPISPLIYGMNYADAGLAKELRLPVRRWGGNATTRYNWKVDTANHGSDWYFKNIPEDNPSPDALPDGSATDTFVAQNVETNSASLLTIPMIGWTPKARDSSCGFSVAKYGPQKEVEPDGKDCGNGVMPDDTLITGNDPTDTSIQIGPPFVQEWMHHLIAKFGTADKGGVAFYDLDNEPDLWNSTQRDVHPQPVSYDELYDLTVKYATAIKEIDPGAKTLGPVFWGWTSYTFSAVDVAPGGNFWENPKDKRAHGDLPIVQWYLRQMHAYELQHHVRLLDYLDLHFYPQEDNVANADAGGPDTRALRLRSTRALWDPNYKDESWIDDYVRLIPWMHEMVNKEYPGTKLAISEYNWGGLEHINGALAQADILGIFGREGLDLATLWGPPDSGMPGAFAFRMYRNYDGNDSGFGETSVAATSADQDKLAIYAALRKDGALTLMVINKSDVPLDSAVTIKGFDAKSVQAFRYGPVILDTIVPIGDQPVSAEGKISMAFPETSITLLVVR